MASIQRTASGWRCQIQRRGVRLSRVFATKAAASAWAIQQEREILDGDVSKWPKKTLMQALDKYAAEVTPRKRSRDIELTRIIAFQRNYPSLCARVISEIQPHELAAWRDARLKQVQAGSVRREMNLLRHVWRIAAVDWQWCDDGLWRGVRLPSDGPARDRIIGWREARRFLRRCGYRTGKPPVTGLELTGYAFLLALRTAMRAGEIVGLTGETVDLERRVVTLEKHKTVEAVGRRHVPLGPQAVRLLRVIWRPGQLLPLNSAMLDALFRKTRDQLLIPELHFHDSRATALTHMARRLDVMTLARVSGHQDLNMLLRRYYRETAEQIAVRLAQPKR